MKAVVLEIRDKKAAVLTHGGQIIKVSNKDYMVGQEVNIREASEKVVDFAKNAGKWMPAAAAAAFLFVIGRFMCISMEPYGVVSLDVNPSIEFTINNMDKVLYVNGVNDDGKNILDSISEDKLINQDIEKAVNVTIEKIESQGYLSEPDRNYVVVAANTVKESHTDKLVSRLDKSISKNEKVQPITMKASDEELNEARERGTSPGKMIIVDKLDSVTEKGINKDEWISKSVADIVNEYDKATAQMSAQPTAVPAAQSQPAVEASSGSNDQSNDNGQSNNSSNNTYTPSSKNSKKADTKKTDGKKSGDASDKNSSDKNDADAKNKKNTGDAADTDAKKEDTTGTSASGDDKGTGSSEGDDNKGSTQGDVTDPAVEPIVVDPTPAPTPVVTPEEPQIPEIPMIPEVPVVPEVPIIPEVPVIPEVPETPETPATPEAPATPETPETPGASQVIESPDNPSESPSDVKTEDYSE